MVRLKEKQIDLKLNKILQKVQVLKLKIGAKKF